MAIKPQLFRSSTLQITAEEEKRGSSGSEFEMKSVLITDCSARSHHPPPLFLRVTLTGIPSAGFAVAFNC